VCLGIPGQIVSIAGDRPEVARVNVAGVDRDIHLGLLEGEPLAPGDWIVIHLGFALSRMTEAEALDAMAFLEGEENPLDVAEVRSDDDLPPWARSGPAARAALEDAR
jgi:hydrogenase expression/formation protein HypC